MMRASFLTLLLLISAASWAVNNGDSGEAPSPIARHLKSMQCEAMPEPGKAMQGAVKFAFGNERSGSVEQFTSGDDWLALSCESSGCTLKAASLTIVQKYWEPRQSTKPSERLVFKLQNPASSGEVVAWFYTATAPAWLKPGTVPTYYAASLPLKPSKRYGTAEIEIAQPRGGTLLLVPMMLSGIPGDAMDSDSHSYLLQLRATGKRQLLLGYLVSYSGNILPSRYLQWSGDLDRDGEPDYLISFSDVGDPVHLYLSSYAKAGQLVGLAGVYDNLSADTCGEY